MESKSKLCDVPLYRKYKYCGFQTVNSFASGPEIGRKYVTNKWLTKQPKLTAIIHLCRLTLGTLHAQMTMQMPRGACSLPSGGLQKTTRTSPHHVSKHCPAGSETPAPYAPQSSADLAQNRPPWRMMSTYGTTQSQSCTSEMTTTNEYMQTVEGQPVEQQSNPNHTQVTFFITLTLNHGSETSKQEVKVI